MAGPLAGIAANAIKYVVSGSARRALTKVIAEINKHYAKSKRKPTAEAIRDRAKRMVEKGKAERSKISKEIKQGGAFSQTSTVPLRLKGKGNVIPKTRTKIGSIPLKRDSKGKYSIKPEKREMLGSRKVIGDKAKNKKLNISGKKNGSEKKVVAKKTTTARNILGTVAASAKRNKGKLLVGAVATGVAVSALKDKGKKKTTTTKTSSKTTTKKNTRTFDRKNFPNPKNLENYMGRRGGINVRKKKKK